MAKSSKKARAPKRERTERRFEALVTHSPVLVQVLGGLGAALLGAGVYGQFIRAASALGKPMPYAPVLVAVGSILLGAAIWLGTTNEPAVRVGDAGVGIDKGSSRHIPWYALESLAFDRARGVLTVRGADDSGAPLTITLATKTYPQAVAWTVKEARARVPAVVDADLGDVPEARSDAGEILALEPLQVVGRRCAASGKIVAYEPDGRVCPACERVYSKDQIPEACACGASLALLRPRKAAEAEGESHA